MKKFSFVFLFLVLLFPVFSDEYIYEKDFIVSHNSVGIRCTETESNDYPYVFVYMVGDAIRDEDVENAVCFSVLCERKSEYVELIKHYSKTMNLMGYNTLKRKLHKISEHSLIEPEEDFTSNILTTVYFFTYSDRDILP